MNLDKECQAAMSRVAYAVNANAEWQKIQIAKEFAKLRKAKEKPSTPDDVISQLYMQQMMAIQNCTNPLYAQQTYFNQAEAFYNPLANFRFGGLLP